MSDMTVQIESIAKRLIESTEGMRHRLVLIIGGCGDGKTKVIRSLANQFGCDPVNLGLHLSRELLELSGEQRKLKVQEKVSKIMKESNGKVIFLDNIEILFGVALKQEPFPLLKNLSRYRTIVSSWSGKMENGNLIYAEPGHCEYKRYLFTDTLFVCMSGESSYNSNLTDKAEIS